MNDRDPTAAERKEAAAIRRRWINIGEVLAVIGVVISALALWNGYSERHANEAERRAGEAERAAEKSRQAHISHLLVLQARSEGSRIAIAPHNPDQAIQGQTILFPSPLEMAAVETTEPRIEAEWVKQAVKKAREKDSKTPGDARMPVAITTRFVAGGADLTDTALYDVGYKESGGGLFGGPNVALRGLSLVARVPRADAQAKLDALWKTRHPAAPAP